MVQMFRLPSSINASNDKFLNISFQDYVTQNGRNIARTEGPATTMLMTDIVASVRRAIRDYIARIHKPLT